MKIKIILILLVGMALVSASRAQSPKYPGDTIEIWTVIDFEENSPYIKINSSADNVWQIGTPLKSFLNSAYTVPKAIITDTILGYPPKNFSWFDLYIGGFNMGGTWQGGYPNDIFVDIRHKFDTDTLADGGYITVSWDKGQTWMNVIYDSVYPGMHPMWQYGAWGGTPNLYSPEQLLSNGEPGFSGNSGGWVHTFMNWFIWPVKSTMDFPPDTMILRFNFVSDENNNNREGWMLDHIRLFSLDLGSGINVGLQNSKRFHIAPNPVTSSALITFDKTYEDVEYTLVDLTGRVLLAGNPGKCSRFIFPRGNISPGLYLLKIKVDKQFTENQYILIGD
jgi:hypothetical protein